MFSPTYTKALRTCKPALGRLRNKSIGYIGRSLSFSQCHDSKYRQLVPNDSLSTAGQLKHRTISITTYSSSSSLQQLPPTIATTTTTTPTPSQTTTMAPSHPTNPDGSPQTHFTIAALESAWVPVPEPLLPEGYTYTLHKHHLTTASEAASRLREADIAIASVFPFPASTLDPSITPRLKHIAVVASGTDQVDKQVCKERGIVVSNTPQQNVGSVAEHVFAGYFATRRRLMASHDYVQRGEWGKGEGARKNSDLLHEYDPCAEGGVGGPPRTCRDEVLGIIGYGGVGRRVEGMARALGMEVLVADRKGSGGGEEKGQVKEGRVEFDEFLRRCSVVVLCCPRSEETLGLMGKREFEIMPGYSLLINVSRGGIVDETALLEALREKKIAGCATDVFLEEPARPESSLLITSDTERLNLLTTPHVAWVAQETIAGYNQALKDNLAGWLKEGRPKFPVVSYN